MRSLATSTYFCSRSIPIKRRPRRLAVAPVVPVPKNGSSTMSPGSVLDKMTRVEQRFGLLGGVRLFAADLQPFIAGTNRQHPVRAHLQIVVQHLHCVVIESVGALLLRFGAPDQGLMGIGEAFAAEIRHRVRLAPDHIVEDPKAQFLKDGADPEYVVIAANHPKRAVVLQNPAAGCREPGAGEPVVVVE